MSFEFAHQMEDEAERAARRFENDIYGIKPWYSHAGLLEGPTTRVFVGAQPGGETESQELDRQYRHLERVYTEPGYNSWLDDIWERKGASLQNRAHRVFRSMYGNDWERVLRSTACLNVAPFRAHSTDDLPGPAWEYAREWFRRVLEQVKPSLIICNGNGVGRSPWAVIDKFYSIDSDMPISVQGRAASLKIGTVVSGPIAEARIVGLPNLSRFGPGQLSLLRGDDPGTEWRIPGDGPCVPIGVCDRTAAGVRRVASDRRTRA